MKLPLTLAATAALAIVALVVVLLSLGSWISGISMHERDALVAAMVTRGTGSRAQQEAERGDDKGIAGVYACQGITADGKLYNGTVHITRHNGVYQLVWTLGPEEHHVGIGLLSGDVLAVSYFGGLPGVVAYRVERDADRPRLVGEWTVPAADGQVFREVLTPLHDGADVPPPPDLPVPALPRRVPVPASMRAV